MTLDGKARERPRDEGTPREIEHQMPKGYRKWPLGRNLMFSLGLILLACPDIILPTKDIQHSLVFCKCNIMSRQENQQSFSWCIVFFSFTFSFLPSDIHFVFPFLFSIVRHLENMKQTMQRRLLVVFSMCRARETIDNFPKTRFS